MHVASLTRTQLRLTALGGNVPSGVIPLPNKLLILKWGEATDLEGRPVIVNATTLSELAANQKKHGFEEVALDFNHSTVKPLAEAEQGKPIYVGGYGTLSVVEGEGVYYHPTSWTPDGESAYTGRHYRDLSATIARNDKNEVTFIHSVALCRNGQIDGITAFSAPSTIPSTNQDNTMQADNKYLALLLTILGLPTDATDEQITAAADTFGKKEKAEDTPAAAAPENVEPLSAVMSRLDAMERMQIVDAATREGKVIPLSAEQISATPATTLRDMVSKLPVTVPLSAAGVPRPGSATPAVTALSAEELTICTKLGITPEDFKQVNA